ncbi:hypothetical protein [Natronoflexus pectinivorans]|uniref:Secreted protein (Por secretion system target) n=1 Tax=Natronoflexus pectinivorans TaxID=682526 RepID=A0A4R2GH00_9BACT|nr:hypothetical protein [Natronoflexus pectinivorans]TCO07649.1 hypothetical protein EV194_10733 [Natronoflexus pectinivorans]
MKRFFRLKSLLLVATFFAVTLAVAAESRISVTPYPRSSFVLVSAIPSDAGFYSVVIQDRSGNVVFVSNRFESGDSFSRLFDFSKLADGDYRARLRNRNGIDSETMFSLRAGRLLEQAPTAVRDSESLAKIWTASDYLFVSHLNKEMKPTAIRLADSKGNIIYSGELPSELTYSGRYNISALPVGDYSVSLISGNTVYNYGFRK